MTKLWCLSQNYDICHKIVTIGPLTAVKTNVKPQKKKLARKNECFQSLTHLRLWTRRISQKNDQKNTKNSIFFFNFDLHFSVELSQLLSNTLILWKALTKSSSRKSHPSFVTSTAISAGVISSSISYFVPIKGLFHKRKINKQNSTSKKKTLFKFPLLRSFGSNAFAMSARRNLLEELIKKFFALGENEEKK